VFHQNRKDIRMDMGIRDRVALVAAASKGFGRAIAHGLAAEGARVAICARAPKPLQQTAKDIASSTNAEILPVAADVTSAEDCRRFVDAAATRWGRIDILVTNSGGPAPGSFDELDDHAWHAAFESTLLNVVRLIRPCLPHMRQQQWGRIVNVQSVSIKQPIPGLLLSNSIRPGCAGLTRSLATDLAAHGILINTVCPGSHETDRIHELAEARARKNNTSSEEELAALAAAVPLKRLGQPEELANAVVFLCSERASYITGVNLLVDGGVYRGTT
jgi:3-oxoacyl-[acyl-carrier protein] reductase